MNPVAAKKPEGNFEKQYSQVIELKSEIQKAIEINMASLSSSLSSKSLESTNHIEHLVSTIEKNKSSIHSNIIGLCNHLSEKMANRIEAFHSLQNMYLASLQKSKLLIKGKNKYKECNLMKKSEMVSIQYEISQLTNKIKIVQMQSNSLETEIANLKKENKNSYTTEISLLEQVMSFDKRLYTVFNAREGIMKQKQQIQNEINQKEMYMKKEITAQTQIKIKAITKQINDCNNALNYITPIQRYWGMRLSEQKALDKELNDYWSISSSKVAELNHKGGEEQNKATTSLANEMNKVNETLMALISNSKTQFPFVIKVNLPSHSNEDPSLSMNSILNAINQVINDKRSQGLIFDKQIQSSKDKMKKIQLTITQTFYRKVNKQKVLTALKENWISNKTEREKIHQNELIEKERMNKLAQIKQKELQLIKELEMRKEKEKDALRLMDMNKEKPEKKPKKGQRKEKNKEKEYNSDDESKKVNKPTIRNIAIPQIANTDKKSHINNNELEKIEKSFESTPQDQISFDNLSFIDEISKNIQEVHNYHQKTIFGDKKNKYSKYDFSYL